MARIGIYGGSFNPPHLGHVLAAKEFQRTLNLDLMLFVPAAIPPHKILSPGSPDGMDRLHLLELAIADLERKGFAVDMETAKYKNGSMVAVYLKQEFGGFAVHLLKK